MVLKIWMNFMWSSYRGLSAQSALSLLKKKILLDSVDY